MPDPHARELGPARSSRAPLTPHQDQYRRNQRSNVAGNAWSILVGLVSVPFLLEGLGPEAFGVWALLQAFSATTGWLSLADLGINTALARETANRVAAGRPLGALPATGLMMSAAAGCACAGALAVVGTVGFNAVFDVSEALESEARVAVIFAAAQAAIDLLTRASHALLEGTGRLDLARGLDVIRRTLSVGGATVAAVTSGRVSCALAAATAGSAISLVVAHVVLRQRGGPIGTARMGETRALLRSARSFGLLNGAGVVHRTMDRLVVGVVLGPVAVGLVEVAGQVQSGITALVNAVAYPTASAAPFRLRESGLSGLRRLTVEATQKTLTVALIAAVPVAILPTPILAVWLGDFDSELPVLVSLAVVYSIVVAAGAVPGYVCQGIGAARRLVRPTVVSVAANAVMTVLLVEAVGVKGALIATIVTTIASTAIVMHITATELGATPGELVRSPLQVAIPAGMVAALGAGLARVVQLEALPALATGALSAATALALAARRASSAAHTSRKVADR